MLSQSRTKKYFEQVGYFGHDTKWNDDDDNDIYINLARDKSEALVTILIIYSRKNQKNKVVYFLTATALRTTKQQQQ